MKELWLYLHLFFRTQHDPNRREFTLTQKCLYTHVKMLNQFSIRNHVNSYFIDQLGLIKHMNLVWVYHL